VIAADGLRIFEGVLAEHRDVLQMDVTRAEPKSRLPMFQLDFLRLRGASQFRYSHARRARMRRSA
jgi:hypothetical protein